MSHYHVQKRFFLSTPLLSLVLSSHLNYFSFLSFHLPSPLFFSFLTFALLPLLSSSFYTTFLFFLLHLLLFLHTLCHTVLFLQANFFYPITSIPLSVNFSTFFPLGVTRTSSSHYISASKQLPQLPLQVAIGALAASHHLGCPLEVLLHPSLTPSLGCAPLKVTKVVQLISKFHQFGLFRNIWCIDNLKALSLPPVQALIISNLE